VVSDVAEKHDPFAEASCVPEKPSTAQFELSTRKASLDPPSTSQLVSAGPAQSTVAK